MLVPLGWLRDYVDLPLDPYKVAEMLAQIGFPVESVHERPPIAGVVAGRIEQLAKHPNADRLQVGTIDAGNGARLTIATAATNVAAGQTIPVAVVGAQLPHLKIERRKMRGVESEGMMISADELALPSDWFEDGIMQLEPGTQPGTDIVEYFGLSHAVLDVEVTTNRVDALSIAGLARELAAYQGLPLRMPAAEPLQPGGTHVRISIDTPDCTRFVAARFEGVEVAPAPAWMRIRLALAGQRPINNLVDISNYVMLETGQPLHFYDAATIRSGHLIVRDGIDGETLTTLDGKEHELSAKDLTIASETGVAGLAGLMGGARTEVGETTRAILLESATFSGARVRRMSARQGIRTEASTRHEKSLPPALATLGAERAAALLRQGGAKLTSVAIAGEAPAPRDAIEFDRTDVRRLLGFEPAMAETAEYLDRLGFAVDSSDDLRLRVTPPPWRPDVTMSADVIEELARMAGYDRIEGVIPSVGAHEIESGEYLLESRVAQTLASLGYHEICTIALQGAHVFEKLRLAGLAPGIAPVEVLNPLSEDQRYLRFALGPAHMQYFARIDRPMRIFETGHVFSQEDGGPVETAVIAFGFTAEPLDEPEWRDSHFLRIKADAQALLHALTGRKDFQAVPDRRNGSHPGKGAALLLDGREAAFVCQVDPRMQKAFGVRLPAYGCWIYQHRIPGYRHPRYRPASKYPGTYRDLAVVCDPEVSAARVQEVIADAAGELCTGVRAFDEYRGAQIASGKKSLAVRISFARTDRTITDEEADAAVATVVAALRERLKASLRA